jgi:hypothetical protein
MSVLYFVQFELKYRAQGLEKHPTRGISGFCHEVDGKRALLDYYPPQSGNSLPTFWDNVPVVFKGKKVKISLPLKMGPIGWPETSVRNYHYTLRNNPEKSR